MGVLVTVVDDRSFAGWAASATRILEIPVTSASDMVAKIIARLTSRLLMFSNRKMSRLNILDHGNDSEIEIGDDVITAATFCRFSPTLAPLTRYFDDDAFVHLQHCEAAKNVSLMEHLADLWRVPIVGGRGLTNPVYRMNTGNYLRVYPAPSGGGTRPAADTFFWGPSNQ
jgi:hypothetical protein